MVTDPRRRDPAINRALRAWHLPPVIQNGTPEDPEPMGRLKAALLIAFYGLAYGPGWMVIFALGHVGAGHLGHH
jgi:hypothetical protein